MPSLFGVRVVRGPSWNWGEADGGEGSTGTVYKSQAGKAGVVWDTGNTGQYRCGHQGCYDLRVINNATMGVKHPISCGVCMAQEITGIRWQCATCCVNICTNCFCKDTLHHPDHKEFKRYETSKITDPPFVAISGIDGPQSRLKLMGIYPGAKVSPFNNLSYGNKCSKEKGTVILDLGAETLGEICVQWSGTKEKEKFQRCSAKGNLILKAKELVSGGLYHPFAFPILRVPVANEIEHLHPALSPGDLLQIKPSKLDMINLVDYNFGYKVSKYLVERVTGIVESVFDSETIIADFDGFKLHLNLEHVCKLNQFSVNDVIRIRKDEVTIKDIEKEYGKTCQNIPVKLDGEIGRVCDTFKEDPKRLLIKFDNFEIYNWLGDREPLPSSWMELYKSDNLAVDRELDEISKRVEGLFYDAVKRGDIRIAKMIYYRHAVDINATVNGKTSLYGACKKGEKEIVLWLLDQPELELEKADYLGYRAIHQAVLRCDADILEMLIRKGAQMNCPNLNGETPLHLAVCKQFKDCARLLIQHGCDVHLQDRMGNTPLHYAILVGIGPKIIQLLVTQLLKRNQPEPILEAKNKTSMTVLLMACHRIDYASVELLVKAGADVKAVDEDLNTAILLAASSPEEDHIPTKDLSPSIFKIYQNTFQDEPNLARLMNRHPALSLLAYLIQMGCKLETTSNSGIRAVDILLEKNCPIDISNVLNRTAAKRERCPLCRCGQVALYFTFCAHHKTSSHACEECFRQNTSRKQDCGCAAKEQVAVAEQITPSAAPSAPAQHRAQHIEIKIKKKKKRKMEGPDNVGGGTQPEPAEFVFEWIDGPKNGVIRDQFGNTYAWNTKIKKDGGMGYRCTSDAGDYEHQKCPAVVRRYVNSSYGTSIFGLELQHLKHRSPVGKTELQQSPEGEIAGPSSCAQSSAKHRRKST